MRVGTKWFAGPKSKDDSSLDVIVLSGLNILILVSMAFACFAASFLFIDMGRTGFKVVVKYVIQPVYVQ